jgi:ATP-dependent helicase/nuclease subunit B
MLVPEQYSHEAERELCRRCGDRLSLFAEVCSFTGLARYMAGKVGGKGEPYLDKGGRLLCMALALKSVGSRLKVYSAAPHRSELQAMLLSAVDELKVAAIDSSALLAASGECPGALGDKLVDLALVLEAYNAVVANGHADPADRLTVLAGQILDSSMDNSSYVYVDGFIDFTRQEQLVLENMLKKNVNLTVCLTVDSLEGDNEVYELSRRAARGLLAQAEELKIETKIDVMETEGDKKPALSYFAENMFSYSEDSYQGDSSAIELYRAESVSAECELAAAKAIELVRDRGCRWRDISILVRGFEDYRGSLESVFRHYGVPLYMASRSDLLQKPIAALFSGVFDIYQSAWAVDDVISYLRTGLTGLDRAACDQLENYIFKWQLRAPAWERNRKWRQHPDGYGMEYDEITEQKLEEINKNRKIISTPLLNYYAQAMNADTAEAQAQAFALLLEQLHLPDTLERRSKQLEDSGREELAAEYRQLWDISVTALEQFAAILGDSPMDMQEFGKLFLLMLSKYDIGTIPVSLDRVSAGDFDRNRRRSLKHLIVLGASDQRLPMNDEQTGVFSQEERQQLAELNLDLGTGGDSELWREFSLIYNGLSLPGESLIMSCPMVDADGGELRPAFVFQRAKAIFNKEVKLAQLPELRMAASAPALSLAAQALKSGSREELAAAEYFTQREPERMERLRAASQLGRGRLSPNMVEQLYGKQLRLSASRIDKFASCKFAYFCQYGLKAKPYKPASFSPPEIGSFMHYVLENVARDVKTMGGFKLVKQGKLHDLCDKYIEKFINSELDDFQEKSKRFVYLFKRLKNDVYQVVEDMAAELSRSCFEPLDFELDFSNASEFKPIELGEGEDRLNLTGIADRVDGWLHEGKLYLRVVDYKTGRKKFSLSDVWYGMNLQMLLYLFSLETDGKRRYGHEIVPAGVMYIPARNAMVSLEHAPEEDEAEKKRLAEIRRSGMVLDDEALMNAWELGDEKLYIPVKFRSGKPSADSVASLERMGTLEKHIKKTLGGMARQLRQGSIAADPYYRSQQENACFNCDYYDACHFSEGQSGESCRYMPKLSTEKVWALMEGGDDNG